MNSLTNEIQNMEFKPMNSEVLKSLGIRVVHWLDLPKYKTIEEICPCVLFIPIESEMQGHYIALWMNGTVLNYFCSYAYPIPITMSKSMYLQSTQIDDEDYLNRMINAFLQKGGKLNMNKYRFQSNKDTSVCGRYCILRLMKRDLSHEQFHNWFKFRNIPNDELICLITYLIK